MTTDWKEWELELLEIYAHQPTTTKIVAKLIGKTEQEVKEKMEQLKK